MSLRSLRVFNSEMNTYWNLNVREDRFNEFLDFAEGQRLLGEKDFSHGISGAAVVGLTTIFTQIPNKFPMMDLLRALAHELDSPHRSDLASVEHSLELFGQKYPTIDGEGNDV